MKKKSQKAVHFLEGLFEAIVGDRQFRRKTATKSESAVQAEIRPIIVRYLERYFEARGFRDAEAKAHASFYWEGQEGQFGRDRRPVFGARNYPDFIVTDPYRVAIEYKKSPYGSTVKQGIGQSIVHTLSGDFEFVLLIFQDESSGRIRDSAKMPVETSIVERLWAEFNVCIRFV